ncbi:MAG: cysteine desulfurase [Prevotella sp.]|nr:cysteine desulfurase [Staphylococcus sp.]MCM1350098.1 cysteine desulfurase [Prevotella sp.]
MIYFDNAATTKCCKEAIHAYCESVNIFGNSETRYKLGIQAKNIIHESKKNISNILGVNTNNIIFTSGGCESNTLAILGCAIANPTKKTIVTSEFEHSSVLNACKFLSEKGYKIVYLKPDNKGIITPEELISKINSDVLLVSIMMVNNEIGTVQPINELVNIAHRYGVLFHSDAVQCTGHLKINFSKLNLDFMSSSAHKFYGPKGIGLLLCKNTLLINNIIFGGEQQYGIRPGTENTQAIYSCSKALEFAYLNSPIHFDKVNELKAYLIDKLYTNKISYKVNSISNYPYILNIQFNGMSNEGLVNFMDLNDICISYGSACNTDLLAPSHVLKSIGLSDDEANSSVRLSFSYENTKEEIDKFIDVLILYISKIKILSKK